jgi:hypothetical protein
MMLLSRAYVVAVIFCINGSNPSLGADFNIVHTQDEPDLITVVGDFAVGDEKKFIDVALTSQNALVAFQSPGGSLIAGIEIGKAIHLKGFATLVPENIQCASACALAWLGGRIRFMSNTAQVGFHAAYTRDEALSAVSAAGNALVGAYLNQLGLPSSAIVYITSAPPEGMQWLNFADAQRVGIDVKSANLTADNNAQGPETSAPARSTKPEPAVSSFPTIKSVTYDFITRSNRHNDEVLLFLQDEYGDQISYYGKASTKASVLADKSAFFQKWPNRNYSIRPNSISVGCENDRTCKVDGVVDWIVWGHGKTSTGSATLSLVWSADSGKWRIVSENSRVINRRVFAQGDQASRVLPRFQLDETQSKLVSLSNLSPDADCVGAWSAGKIVQRKVANDGITMTGFVMENSDGSREFINVNSIPIGEVDRATVSWVERGLHTLLAERRLAEIYVRLCGASGRVQMLDAVQ